MTNSVITAPPVLKENVTLDASLDVIPQPSLDCVRIWSMEHLGSLPLKHIVISSTAKNILHEFFESVDWPLNKGLPRGAEFFSGPLGDIFKQHGLEKAQVLRQLLNYKRGKYTQVSILLNPPDLDETLRKGIGCTTQFL